MRRSSIARAPAYEKLSEHAGTDEHDEHTSHSEHDHHHHRHPSIINAFPLLSQAKSSYQWLRGDSHGARETQQDFVRTCPGISQATSIVQLAKGDRQAAWDTQKQQLAVVSAVCDKTPVVGHAKGAVHYMLGQPEQGKQAMIMATRTTVVSVAGAVGLVVDASTGFLDGGAATVTAVAVAGGVMGGVAYDSTVSAATRRPFGYVAAVDQARKGTLTPGGQFEAMLMPITDGIGGASGLGIADGLMDSGGPEAGHVAGPDTGGDGGVCEFEADGAEGEDRGADGDGNYDGSEGAKDKGMVGHLKPLKYAFKPFVYGRSNR